MNSTTFSENLKKFRLAKNYTQEYVAETLHINSQTVSRWECGTTLPDVLMLPELARLYEVTVDDFYKKNSIAYKNYAQRLASVYEKTEDPEDFLRCVIEYNKLMKNDEFSIEDKWNYAFIHHVMLVYCKKVAMEWYDKAIAGNSESDPHSHARAGSCRAGLFFDIGRGDQFIRDQEYKVNSKNSRAEDWILLIDAYIKAERYYDGYAMFEKATERFTDRWEFYIYGGIICRITKQYEEALALLKKAGDMGTDFYDEKYEMAYCYQDMGEYEKAYNVYIEISDLLRKNGYDVEAEMVEEDAKEVKRLIKA